MAARKAALITGSSDPSGLGYATASILLARHGFDVLISGRDQAKTESAAKTLNDEVASASDGKEHGKAYPLVLDVADDASIQRAVETLSGPTSPLSDGRLDVLINNAGLGAPPGRSGKGTQSMFLQTQDTTSADVMTVFQTNVAAVVQLTNALLPALSKSSEPRIVNVSSARGSISFAASLEPARTGAMVYNASKTALNMVTVMQAKNLPAVVGPALLVNGASPGHVATPFNNFSGARTREQGVAVIVHLATEEKGTGRVMGDHAPFSSDGTFVDIPW